MRAAHWRNSQLYYKMFTFVLVGALLSVAMATAAPKPMPEAAAEPYWYGDADTNCGDWTSSCHLPEVYRVCASTCGVAYPALAYDYGYGAYPYAAGYDYAYGSYDYAYGAYPYAQYGLNYDVYGRATRYWKKK